MGAIKDEVEGPGGLNELCFERRGGNVCILQTSIMCDECQGAGCQLSWLSVLLSTIPVALQAASLVASVGRSDNYIYMDGRPGRERIVPACFNR